MKNPFSLPALPALKEISLALIMFCMLATSHAQEQRTSYKVIFHGDSVGNMLLYQNKTGDNASYAIVSSVQIHFLLKFSLVGKEEANFQNGRLMYSSVSRKVNGKEKAAKQTKSVGNSYEATSFGKTVPSTDKPINYNMNMLYCQEPFNKQAVYSDNFQQFLTVEQVALHKYKIALPDGNYNYYTFSNGICSMVELHHSFYTVYMQLEA